MSNDYINKIKLAIMNDVANIEYTKRGLEPLFRLTEQSKIIIIGQAPGIKAEKSKMTWNDLSGDRLREWLNVSRDEFYNPNLFGQMPMDFYYPGKGKSGDLPPRKGFAKKWHPKLLECVKDVKLIILIGAYSQEYYINDHLNLTDRVQNYKQYLPNYFVLAHPSPLNFKWRKENPWFLEEVIPKLQERIREIIGS